MDMMCTLEWEPLDPKSGSGAILCEVLRSLDEQGLIAEDSILSISGRRSKPLKSTAHLIELCARTGRMERHRILSKKRKQQYGLTINQRLSTRIDLFLCDEEFELRRGSLISSFLAVSRHLVQGHVHSFLFGPYCGVDTSNFSSKSAPTSQLADMLPIGPCRSGGCAL